MNIRHLASHLVVLALLLPMIQGCHRNGGKRTVETGIPNDPVSIRKPELTSSEHFSVVGEEDGDGYGNTPDGLTLFIPPEKLSRYDIAKTVKDNYNYVLIRDMIVNDFEWMRREMIDLGLDSGPSPKSFFKCIMTSTGGKTATGSYLSKQRSGNRSSTIWPRYQVRRPLKNSRTVSGPGQIRKGH